MNLNQRQPLHSLSLLLRFVILELFLIPPIVCVPLQVLFCLLSNDNLRGTPHLKSKIKCGARPDNLFLNVPFSKPIIRVKMNEIFCIILLFKHIYV